MAHWRSSWLACSANGRCPASWRTWTARRARRPSLAGTRDYSCCMPSGSLEWRGQVGCRGTDRRGNGSSASIRSGASPCPHCRRRNPVTDGPAQRLGRHVIEPLKARFVGRDEVVDLIALAVVAGEHLFLLGPPGTAKSLIVRRFAAAVHCRYFEYLLTRFSEPNEIFGPVDLARLREGVVATVTAGMLPEAEFA